MAEVRSVSLPWENENPVPCNMAIGNIRENLLAWLTTERGIHAETLLCIIGSMTGYAGQMAIWENYIKLNRPTPPNGFMSAETNSGQRFYFGDLLNGFLLPQVNNDFPLWMFVAGAAVSCGVDENNLPNPGVLFKQAASTIGTPEYDILTVPENHLPQMTPRQCVEIFWLSISKLMTIGYGPGKPQLPPPKPEHWPIVLSVVAQQMIIKTKDVLDPALAVHIVMQSSIIASKYDAKELKLRPAH